MGFFLTDFLSGIFSATVWLFSQVGYIAPTAPRIVQINGWYPMVNNNLPPETAKKITKKSVKKSSRTFGKKMAVKQTKQTKQNRPVTRRNFPIQQPRR